MIFQIGTLVFVDSLCQRTWPLGVFWLAQFVACGSEFGCRQLDIVLGSSCSLTVLEGSQFKFSNVLEILQTMATTPNQEP